MWLSLPPTHTHTGTPPGFWAVLLLSGTTFNSENGSALRLQQQMCHHHNSQDGGSGTKKTQVKNFSQEELKKRLTPLQYRVTQEKGTESAFSGEFTHHRDEGTYTCVVCGDPLFSSNAKFDSGSGWPSFFDLMKEDSITESDDFSAGMHRLEVACSRCGAHLGHLFDDGPKPTGSRYCINSASLSFQPKQEVTVTSCSEADNPGASLADDKSDL